MYKKEKNVQDKKKKGKENQNNFEKKYLKLI